MNLYVILKYWDFGLEVWEDFNIPTLNFNVMRGVANMILSTHQRMKLGIFTQTNVLVSQRNTFKGRWTQAL